jgi:hypothetical protein
VVTAQDTVSKPNSGNWLYDNSDLIVLAYPVSVKNGKELTWNRIFKVQEVYTVFQPITVMKDTKGIGMNNFKLLHYKLLEFPPRSSPPLFISFSTAPRQMTAESEGYKVSESEHPLYLLFLSALHNRSMLYEPTGGHDRAHQACLEVYPELGLKLAINNFLGKAADRNDTLKKPDVKYLEKIARKALSEQHPELNQSNISLITVRYQYDYNLDGSVYEVFVVAFRMNNSLSELNSYGEHKHVKCTRILVQIEPDGKVVRDIGITPTVSEITAGKEKVVAMGRGGIEKWQDFRKQKGGALNAPCSATNTIEKTLKQQHN